MSQRTILVIQKPESAETFSHRSIWISDVHLGTKHAQVTALLDFLRVNECQHLYIVGDLIDGWELKHKWFWREEYNLLIKNCFAKVASRRASLTSRATTMNSWRNFLALGLAM